MKKKIAIMLTLILAAGTFTACTAGEKVNNNDIQTSVVSNTADVSASEEMKCYNKVVTGEILVVQAVNETSFKK